MRPVTAMRWGVAAESNHLLQKPSGRTEKEQEARRQKGEAGQSACSQLWPLLPIPAPPACFLPPWSQSSWPRRELQYPQQPGWVPWSQLSKADLAFELFGGGKRKLTFPFREASAETPTGKIVKLNIDVINSTSGSSFIRKNCNSVEWVYLQY